jgi:opacity protein-like surface antigen
MKKLLMLAGALIISTPALAETNSDTIPPWWYLSIGAGVTHTSDADWSGFGLSGDIGIDRAANLSGAVGARVWESVRTELEVSYRKADLSDISLDGAGSADAEGDVKTWAALINAYYDFLPAQDFSPYVSLGLGAARHHGELDAIGGLGTPGTDGSDTVFAYQIGAGASYSLTEKTALWGGYRFLGTSDPDFDGVSAEYDAHELRLGLRFNF